MINVPDVLILEDNFKFILGAQLSTFLCYSITIHETRHDKKMKSVTLMNHW